MIIDFPSLSKRHSSRWAPGAVFFFFNSDIILMDTLGFWSQCPNILDVVHQIFLLFLRPGPFYLRLWPLNVWGRWSWWGWVHSTEHLASGACSGPQSTAANVQPGREYLHHTNSIHFDVLKVAKIHHLLQLGFQSYTCQPQPTKSRASAYFGHHEGHGVWIHFLLNWHIQFFNLTKQNKPSLYQHSGGRDQITEGISSAMATQFGSLAGTPRAYIHASSQFL